MDLNEFRQKNTPGHRRSRLDPYLAEILQLRTDGYSLSQIRVFLQARGVTTSNQNLAGFIARRAGVPAPGRGVGAAGAVPPSPTVNSIAPTAEAADPVPSADNPETVLAQIGKAEEREKRYDNLFKKPPRSR